MHRSRTLAITLGLVLARGAVAGQPRGGCIGRMVAAVTAPEAAIDSAMRAWAADGRPRTDFRLWRVDASTVVETSERERRREAFLRQVKDLERNFYLGHLPTPSERASTAAGMAIDASRHLEAQGVTHIVEWQDGRIRLVILPTERTLFGRFAGGVRKYHPEFEVIYDPWKLLDGTAAYVTPPRAGARPVFGVSSRSVALATPAESAIRHEIVHAVGIGKRVRGNRALLSSHVTAFHEARDGGIVFTASLPLESHGYPGRLNFEELLAFPVTLREKARDLARSLARGDQADFASHFAELRLTVERARGLHEQSLEILDLLDEARARGAFHGGAIRVGGRTYRVRALAPEPASPGSLRVRFTEEGGVGHDAIGFDLEVPAGKAPPVDGGADLAELSRIGRDRAAALKATATALDAPLDRVLKSFLAGDLDGARAAAEETRRTAKGRPLRQYPPN